MNDWNMLDWLVAFGVIASLFCAIFAGWSLFRRAKKSETIQSFASGKNSRLTQVQASPNSTIVMDSPSTVVVRGNLNITPGYDIDEHERIVNERVAQVRADIERAHQAEIDGLQA
jgi:sortase (surface protein transpeptidase)